MFMLCLVMLDAELNINCSPCGSVSITSLFLLTPIHVVVAICLCIYLCCMLTSMVSLISKQINYYYLSYALWAPNVGILLEFSSISIRRPQVISP